MRAASLVAPSGMKTIGGTNVLVNLNLFCKGKLHLGGDQSTEALFFQ